MGISDLCSAMGKEKSTIEGITKNYRQKALSENDMPNPHILVLRNSGKNQGNYLMDRQHQLEAHACKQSYLKANESKHALPLIKRYLNSNHYKAL